MSMALSVVENLEMYGVRVLPVGVRPALNKAAHEKGRHSIQGGQNML